MKLRLPIVIALSVIPLWFLLVTQLIKTSYLGYFLGVTLFFLAILLFFFSVIALFISGDKKNWLIAALSELLTVIVALSMSR